MMDWTASPAAPLDVNGLAIEYACYGPSTDKAATIVMLHEGLGCLALWRDFPQKVAEATGLGVFVFSRPGYGASSPVTLPRPLDFMTREAKEFLPGLLDAIGFQRGILFGHSDGATVSAIYAGSVEDLRVRGLILMAPHFFNEDVCVAEIAKARDAYDSGDLKPRLAKYHKDVDGAFLGWADTWLDPGFRNWNVAEVIDYFRIPALAIQGRDDQYGTLAQVQEVETRAYSPVDLVILDDCKHAPHLEQPDATLAAVADFVARLERIEAEQVSLA
ncbi:alpha/beta fold hydrolase [Aestuariivita boseongensis]|uniref:alpha/beta fold hydrolase n=1 Tax=Aestuariivita boseongensis TaxID=1470562 RepID=UPI000AA73ECD|nr:alpha/beta hydrolase [Aestuariivita boseongensis]